MVRLSYWCNYSCCRVVGDCIVMGLDVVIVVVVGDNGLWYLKLLVGECVVVVWICVGSICLVGFDLWCCRW